jgi:ferredoxin--NADP+ reductase
VIRSIGYRGRPLPGVPFDDRRGIIRNEGGRVCDEDRTVRTGEYAVGWIKRGPSGVIGTNKKCATDTVARVLEDLAGGRLADPPAAHGEAWLRTRVPGLVTWRGWEAIDEHEQRLGAPQGRPRVKLVRMPQLFAAAAQNTGVSA